MAAEDHSWSCIDNKIRAVYIYCCDIIDEVKIRAVDYGNTVFVQRIQTCT